MPSCAFGVLRWPKILYRRRGNGDGTNQRLRISQNNLWVMLHRASGVYGVELVREQTLARYGPMGTVDKSSSAENPSLLAGRNWFERMLVSFIAERTPKCREVVRLLSKSMEDKLPLATRIKIRFHYLICFWCY